MNWRRGLKRLLAIGCLGWALNVLVYWPIQQINSATDLALAYTPRFYPDDWQQRRDTALEHATWGYQYKALGKELVNEPLLAAFLIGTPFVIYGILYGVIWTGIWLVQGFRRSA